MHTVHSYIPYLCIGWLLGAFFCGYLITQIPGGWLAHRFGAKHVLGIGIVMTALLTLLTPLAASISVWALVAVRALEGLFEVRRGWSSKWVGLEGGGARRGEAIAEWIHLHDMFVISGRHFPSFPCSIQRMGSSIRENKNGSHCLLR